MKKSDHLLKGLLSAIGVLVYTSAVAWLGFHNQEIFGKPTNFLTPLFVLLLFVISASITGLLVLGKPIHLYLSGLKKEAFTLLFATLAWLILFIIVVVFILLIQ
ncbi:MAG: hypothetical protein HYT40_03720 [Candidatus Sungbacteria bacterium]|uniref:Uncharacterized protein n=1 Tax=Candidatus Sungiibacteriota bacterium TaxID=2750080 RepID=A0A931WNE3_9BACT|nr:hypothetical protein [Candidatus Sungbacteria bacterium]